MKQTTFLTSFEKRSVLLFASLGLAAAGQAFAQSTAAKPGAGTRTDAATLIKQADANGDGRLDRQEAQTIAGLTERFDAVDTDRDGAISLQELTVAMTRPAG
jgi:hypothetical protein